MAGDVDGVDSKLAIDDLNTHEKLAPPVLLRQCSIAYLDLVDVGLR
jgi:hypothetical protein